MNEEHEVLEELVALYAAGSLREADAAKAREHLGMCAACRADHRELAAVAGLIGYAAENDAAEHELRLTRIKRRLLRRIGGDAARATDGAGTRIPWWQQARTAQFAFAAALLLAFIAVLANSTAQRQVHHAEVAVQFADAQADSAALAALRTQQQLAAVIDPEARRYPVPGGLIVARGDRLYLALTHLPAVSKDHAYQVWTLPAGDKKMKPGTTFLMNSAGIAFVGLPDRASETVVVAVSIEPRRGSPAPTTKPLFVAPLRS